MTKELKTIDLNLLPIVTLGEMANEAAEQVEKNAKATVQKAIDCGRYLTAIKEQLEHGQWGGWLGANWNYSHDTANRYMTLANSACVRNLIEAKSINEALRIISDSKPETVPRSERKPADVVVSIPDEPNETNETEVDDDPTPDPPTNRKTAKGSEKVSEEKKPRTQTVAAEILNREEVEDGGVILRESDTDGIREFFRRCVIVDEGDLKFVIEALIRKTENKHGQKKLAVVLRKWSNELDPPTKFRRPESDDVLALLREYAATKEFIEKYGTRSDMELAIATEGFIDHYDGNGWLIGKAAMKDWQATARKWLRNQPQFANGKANGNGAANRGTIKRRPTVEEVFG